MKNKDKYIVMHTENYPKGISFDVHLLFDNENGHELIAEFQNNQDALLFACLKNKQLRAKIKGYKVYDLQCCEYFREEKIFKSVNDVIEALAGYHEFDFAVEDGEKFRDIYKYLNSLKTNKNKLDFLCEYGGWKIEKIRGQVKV